MSGSPRILRRLCLLGLLALAGGARAAIEFEGSGNYRIDGRRIDVSFDRVCNTRSGGRSGTLHLQLVASADADPAGPIHPMTNRIPLGELDGGQCYVNLSFPGRAYSPPATGSYHVFLAVFEFPERSTFLDAVPAEGNPVRLVREASVSPPAGSRGVEIVGGGRYQRDGASVTIEADRISNASRTRTTGTLHLSIVASPRDTPIGNDVRILARASLAEQFRDLGRLPPNSSFRNVALTAPWTQPPAGTWNLFLVLSEYPELDTAVDWAAFDAPLVIDPPAPDPTPGILAPGGSTSGALSVAGEVDRFRIVLPRDGTLEVFTRGGTDTIGRLLDARGVPLAEDDDAGDFLNFSIRRTVAAGTYLVEVTGYANSTGPYTLVSAFEPTAPPPPPPSPDQELGLVGSVGYSRTGGSVTLTAERITNLSPTRTTGTLYLTLFATTGTSVTGTRGYDLARISLARQFADSGRLRPNSSFSEVRLTGPFTEPPPGSYNLFLVLSEFPEEDVVVDSVAFDRPLRIDAPPPPPPPSPNPAGGGGGGGASGGGGCAALPPGHPARLDLMYPVLLACLGYRALRRGRISARRGGR